MASSTSTIAEKCEWLGTVRPTAWTAAIWPLLHICSSGAKPRVQPEDAVGLEELAGWDADGRTRHVVVRVAVRDDQRHAVGSAPLAEHDQDVGSLSARGEGGLPEDRAMHRGHDAARRHHAEPLQEVPPRRRRTVELVAPRVPWVLVMVFISSLISAAQVFDGVEDADQKRGNAGSTSGMLARR